MLLSKVLLHVGLDWTLSSCEVSVKLRWVVGGLHVGWWRGGGSATVQQCNAKRLVGWWLGGVVAGWLVGRNARVNVTSIPNVPYVTCHMSHVTRRTPPGRSSWTRAKEE
jgi:hypothetical protein